ncbi:hypothetical protein BDR04DRAFT_1140434 [Suillus decipiens]|nr:hypothetical protein BDR04DRAFT_1140434 [Suillus decipiens]
MRDLLRTMRDLLRTMRDLLRMPWKVYAGLIDLSSEAAAMKETSEEMAIIRISASRVHKAYRRGDVICVPTSARPVKSLICANPSSRTYKKPSSRVRTSLCIYGVSNLPETVLDPSCAREYAQWGQIACLRGRGVRNLTYAYTQSAPNRSIQTKNLKVTSRLMTISAKCVHTPTVYLRLTLTLRIT